MLHLFCNFPTNIQCPPYLLQIFDNLTNLRDSPNNIFWREVWKYDFKLYLDDYVIIVHKLFYKFKPSRFLSLFSISKWISIENLKDRIEIKDSINKIRRFIKSTRKYLLETELKWMLMMNWNNLSNWSVCIFFKISIKLSKIQWNFLWKNCYLLFGFKSVILPVKKLRFQQSLRMRWKITKIENIFQCFPKCFKVYEKNHRDLSIHQSGLYCVIILRSVLGYGPPSIKVRCEKSLLAIRAAAIIWGIQILGFEILRYISINYRQIFAKSNKSFHIR